MWLPCGELGGVTMNKSAIPLAALLLIGCAHEQALVPVAQATPPPKSTPPLVYFKQGASNEDFQRARARCRMNSEMSMDMFNDPYRWLMIYRSCMRADG